MRRFFFLVFALLISACQKPTTSGTGGEPLRVGMELAYPPFETQDKSGHPDGVSVKLAEALAADLGRPVKIVPMEFSGLIPALKSGTIDVIISSMTATEERRKSIDFSEPYAFIGLGLLVGKDSAIQSVDDLRKPGTRLAVKATTTGETWATHNLPDARRIAFSEEAACVQEVAQGRADAFIYDQLSIYRFHKKNPNTTRALLKPVVEEAWAVGLARGNEDLKSHINAFLTKFRREGGLEKLGDRYLSDEKKALEEQDIPFMLR